MDLTNATLLLLFAVAAFAVNPSFGQTAAVEDFPDFDDNFDDDVGVVIVPTTSKEITEAAIITGTTVSSVSTTVSTTSSQILQNDSITSSPATTSSTTNSSTKESSISVTKNDNSTSSTKESTTVSTTTSQTSTAEDSSKFSSTAATSPSAITDSSTKMSTTFSETTTQASKTSTPTISTTISIATTDSTTKLSSTKSTVIPATTDKTTLSTSVTDSTTSVFTTDSSTTIQTSTTTESIPTVPTTTTEQQTEEELILALLAESKFSLTESGALLKDINTINWNISEKLDNQVEFIELIEDTDKILKSKTQEILFWEAELLQGVVKSIKKIDLYANRTVDTISHLLELQKLNQDRVKDLENKLKDTQGQILRRSKGLDARLKFVSHLLRDYIEPKVNHLKDSFARVNKSQVNSLGELENLSQIRNLTETFNIKLTSLNYQVAALNETQEISFYTLNAALDDYAPTNLNAINDLFHTISISQKQTDFSLATCGSSKYSTNIYSNLKNYNKQYVINGPDDLIDISKPCILNSGE
ncbi:serine-rich adhesin for platelets [Drosophila ficusphila]|uniref:serine-rich adhesin for platelets n=1 Tax=Drosophila ficusphila TaxID=30025 RepID=UPI0007E6E714|nr:serine-rich adhesin for platelets [Drosophila ficusphila]